jgi:hypothetical protein
MEDVGNSMECGCGVSFKELFLGCFSCNRALYRGRHVQNIILQSAAE